MPRKKADPPQNTAFTSGSRPAGAVIGAEDYEIPTRRVTRSMSRELERRQSLIRQASSQNQNQRASGAGVSNVAHTDEDSDESSDDSPPPQKKPRGQPSRCNKSPSVERNVSERYRAAAKRQANQATKPRGAPSRNQSRDGYKKQAPAASRSRGNSREASVVVVPATANTAKRGRRGQTPVGQTVAPPQSSAPAALSREEPGPDDNQLVSVMLPDYPAFWAFSRKLHEEDAKLGQRIKDMQKKIDEIKLKFAAKDAEVAAQNRRG